MIFGMPAGFQKSIFGCVPELQMDTFTSFLEIYVHQHHDNEDGRYQRKKG